MTKDVVAAGAGAAAAAAAGAREKTATIAEFNLKFCYGNSLMNMAAPGCFRVGYTYSEEKKCLVQTDRHTRAKSF
jgi:hypothetical protein